MEGKEVQRHSGKLLSKRGLVLSSFRHENCTNEPIISVDSDSVTPTPECWQVTNLPHVCSSFAVEQVAAWTASIVQDVAQNPHHATSVGLLKRNQSDSSGSVCCSRVIQLSNQFGEFID